jgi:hypothetical protein
MNSYIDRKYNNIRIDLKETNLRNISPNFVCPHLNQKLTCDICLRLNALVGIQNSIDGLKTSIYDLKKSIDNLNKK